MILFPPGAGRQAVQVIFTIIGEGLEAVGAVLVGGHTEITKAVTQPVLVGQMMGISEQGVSSPPGEPNPVMRIYTPPS